MTKLAPFSTVCSGELAYSVPFAVANGVFSTVCSGELAYSVPFAVANGQDSTTDIGDSFSPGVELWPFATANGTE
jgi:hypothetical protein